MSPPVRTSPTVLVVFACTLAAASGLAFWLGRSSSPGSEKESGAAQELTTPSGEEATIYYCTMHPNVRLSHPGKCSRCPMDLVPLRASGLGPRALAVSEAAMQLAEIETARVTRQQTAAEIRMVGTIDFDETQVKTITAWMSGRLDRLYVDYTGIPVKPGDHLADIYSPKLFAAQQQLIEARKAVQKLQGSESEFMRSSTLGTLEAVRDKLRLLGLGEEQIAEMEKREKPGDHVLITAPIGGIVVSKLADEGDYVETGDPIYKIAELSHLWVKLDAYESDLTWLRYGQEVEFYTESYPGELFRGKISFIDWVVERRTRTTKVRVNVENPDLKLKPGMFVRAQVRSELRGGGRVMNPLLQGKWVSPMHPEIVKDGPGKCDLCGMDLVPAETLFAGRDEDAELPLVVPASAALVTGRRAVVYVKLPDRETATFEGREVVLGPRAGAHYVVLAGLEEGEEVVVRGNFKIDSALQIEAKPSMMNPEGGGGGGAHHHGAPGEAKAEAPPARTMPSMARLESSTAFQGSLTDLRGTYFEIGEGLAADDIARAKQGFTRFGELLARVPAGELDGDAAGAWKDLERPARNEALLAATADDIATLRESFRKLSRVMLHAEHVFGHSDGTVFYEAFCPMAFDGAGDSWLQRDKTIANPYFGSAMLRCGDIRGEFASRSPGSAPPVGDEKQPRAEKGSHDHE